MAKRKATDYDLALDRIAREVNQFTIAAVGRPIERFESAGGLTPVLNRVITFFATELDDPREFSYGPSETAIWQGDRLVAAVFRSPDGEPRAVHFDGPDGLGGA